jgi:hypothetical protein
MSRMWNVLIHKAARPWLAWILPWLAGALLHAQNPELFIDNLRYSREMFSAHHLVVQVIVERPQQERTTHFRYDRLAAVKRIAMDDGIAYAQRKGQAWLQSKDWGKTGLSVSGERARDLDQKVRIAELPLSLPEAEEKNRSAPGWKLVDKADENSGEIFTFERSKEKKSNDGTYARYTFIKYKGDVDGRLALHRFNGRVRLGKELLGVDLRFSLIVILPANGTTGDQPKAGKE